MKHTPYAQMNEEQKSNAKAAVARWKKKNPKVVREAVLRWRKKNPEAYAAAKARSRAKHREKNRISCQEYMRSKPPEWRRARVLWNLYKITPEQYEKLVTKQNGVCAICKEPERVRRKGVTTRLAVDHNHACCSGKRSCGKCVRGLLCNACNRALAALRDDATRLRNALAYLEESQFGSNSRDKKHETIVSLAGGSS